MEIRNLTQHIICICDDVGRIIDKLHPYSNVAARVVEIPGTQLSLKSYTGDKIFYTARKWGGVENLPKPEKGVIFIVSRLVAQQCVGRRDIFSPGTGLRDGPVRENGKIIGVRRFIQAPQE